MKIVSFLHSGGVGDIVYSLPCMLSILQNEKAESANIYLQLGKTTGYSGWHPLGNQLLNQDFVDKTIPLLKSQNWVNEVKVYNAEHIDVDLNKFRQLPINPTTYCLPRWYFLCEKGTNWNLANCWLSVESNPKFKDYIFVSRNPRLKSTFINYRFMNDYADKLIFTGVRREFEDFRKECPDCKNFYEAKNFLELSQVLTGARFFVGNQGFIYTLTEAMKLPRLLETNNMAANNIPQGENCYDALFQPQFEHWFHYMMKEYT
jgi:hypothetical protein